MRPRLATEIWAIIPISKEAILESLVKSNLGVFCGG
jgi:hypothetical protein